MRSPLSFRYAHRGPAPRRVGSPLWFTGVVDGPSCSSPLHFVCSSSSSGAPPFRSAHNMGLFFAVSWVPDDGHARSLRSLRIACSFPLLADRLDGLLVAVSWNTMTLSDSLPVVARAAAASSAPPGRRRDCDSLPPPVGRSGHPVAPQPARRKPTSAFHLSRKTGMWDSYRIGDRHLDREQDTLQILTECRTFPAVHRQYPQARQQ